MKIFISRRAFVNRVLLAAIMFLPVFLMAEGNWPKEIKTAKSTIIMYQPQPDSIKGDHIYARAAMSFTTSKTPAPVFGAVWTDSRFSTDRESGICTIYDVNIMNIRFPGIDTMNPAKVGNFTKILEEETTSWNMEFSMEELKATLALNQVAARKSSNFKNDPPDIIFSRQHSVLLIFDHEPVLREIENTGIKRAMNTPFLVLYDMQDRNYYLYGATYWFKSMDPVKGPWANIPAPSPGVARYFNELQKENENLDGAADNGAANQKGGAYSGIPKIVVSTRPAELIQSQGEPQYAPIQGTHLLYMTNTNDNIFMTTDDNQYYILITGRWYRASSLSGPWAYIDSDNLPADFARIPEGSEKDLVLASVAGTDAASDAVMDAQIPQTAAVDRKTARCEVSYNGDPKFETIRGTELYKAMNTNSTVLLYRNIYFVCDNAVWFTGQSPVGPWEVATSIPDEIQKIPPEDPAYNVKYVYIYDVRPDVVYIGYTPGYTGCYVYGPTVVYGTGWRYAPFFGSYYYPHPMTYGFCMHYNPWYGWSMGFSMSGGWYHYGHGGYRGYHGGWWGPSMYRPPYHPPYNHYYGSRRPSYRGGDYNVNINSNRTNIYNRRTDGSAWTGRQPSVSPQPGQGERPGSRPSTGNDRTRPGSQPPAGNDRTRPGNQQPSREAKPPERTGGQKNNVFTDRSGNVYRNENGNWQQHNGRNWETTQPKPQDRNVQQQQSPRPQDVNTRQGNPGGNSGFNRQEMEKQNQARQRGSQNMNNRSNVQQAAPAGNNGRAPANAPGTRSGNNNGGRKR